MANLYGHAAVNGGYRQGEPKVLLDTFLTRRTASPRPLLIESEGVAVGVGRTADLPWPLALLRPERAGDLLGPAAHGS